MSAAQLAAVRTGGVFPAKEAQGLKLIDGIQSFDKTLTALASAK
jgi:ClpP class serine protease